MSNSNKINVLFVCLGNICRSPMAEGIFKDYVVKQNLENRFNIIDSCGTAGYHIGSRPDSRTLSVLKANGIVFEHKARQLCENDFYTFDYILVMDLSNLEDVNSRRPKNSHAKVQLFGEYGEEGESKIVKDPYYGSIKGFETNFKQLSSFSKNFCSRILGAI